MTSDNPILPHASDRVFLTDGGLETTLVFHDGYELPAFAAFVLLDTSAGREHLRRYYARYLELARSGGYGFVLESPTWRSSPEWGARIGYSASDLARINRDAIALMHELRAAHGAAVAPIAVSGCVGPRGDGYDPAQLMSQEAATAYHADQIRIFAAAGVDLISAITMTNVPEAVGVTRAAQAACVPAVISFTLETDGRLPTGESLADAIRAVDDATAGGPAYYMINCAHPEHFSAVLAGGEWLSRIGGVRANASRKSHAELDACSVLDDGNPEEFGRDYRALRSRLPRLNVLGGCCGTDHRHVAEVARAWAA